MSSFHYVTRTIALPVRADGRTIKDAYGQPIAFSDRDLSPMVAEALVDLINLGTPAALAREAAHEEQEAEKARMLFSAIKTELKPAAKLTLAADDWKMRRDALARDQAAVHINRTIENAYNSGGSKSDVRLHAMEAMRESGAEPSTDTLDLVLKTLFPR